MDTQGQLYTAGLWTVRPGKEADFIRAWDEFARWTSEHQPGAGEAHLLQDLTNAQRFLSFGPWENAERVQAWRATPQFAAFVAQARELCEDFQPGSFKVAAQVSSNADSE
jgi:heme-degrading monooxygenase HmoA